MGQKARVAPSKRAHSTESPTRSAPTVVASVSTPLGARRITTPVDGQHEGGTYSWELGPQTINGGLGGGGLGGGGDGGDGLGGGGDGGEGLGGGGGDGGDRLGGGGLGGGGDGGGDGGGTVQSTPE